MARIMILAVGGPLDGKYLSTDADVDAFEGFADMPEGSKYIKLSDTLRDFATKVEKDLADLLFSGHDVQQYCEFVYSA